VIDRSMPRGARCRRRARECGRSPAGEGEMESGHGIIDPLLWKGGVKRSAAGGSIAWIHHPAAARATLLG